MNERTTTEASGTEHRVDPATERRRRDRTAPPGRTAPASDERRRPATPLPPHWTFPAWYVMFLDGAVRPMSPWEITLPIGDGYAISSIFWPAVVLPTILVVLPMVYPLLEARMRRDNREHHLLDRATSRRVPRWALRHRGTGSAPTRTAAGGPGLAGLPAPCRPRTPSRAVPATARS